MAMAYVTRKVLKGTATLNSEISFRELTARKPRKLPWRPRTRDEHDLTPMEARIYTLIVEEGLSGREIGIRLGYTYESARSLSKLVQEKLGTTRLKMVVEHWKRQVK